MAILTAQQFKDRERNEFLIDIGGGGEVLARVPDVHMMVMTGVIATPLLGEVVKLVGAWAGAELTSQLTEDVITQSDKILTFVNAYVCASLIQPLVYGTEEARAAAGHEADGVLISDLTLMTRRRIFLRCVEEANKTYAAPEVVAAAKDFPENGPGEGAGPDVPALPDPAVVSA